MEDDIIGAGASPWPEVEASTGRLVNLVNALRQNIDIYELVGANSDEIQRIGRWKSFFGLYFGS